MYEPIMKIFQTQMELQMEGEIMKAVRKVGVTVDKEELLKALKYDRQQYDKGYEDAKREQQWIPCSERLPQWGEDCLVTVKFKYEWEKEYEYHTDVGSYRPDGKWNTYNDWYEGQEYFEAIAWMPLPEPYKESEKQNGTL